MIARQLEDLNRNLVMQAGFSHRFDDPEDVFAVPAVLGSGLVSTMRLRPGLWLVRTQLNFTDTQSITLAPTYPHLEVLYVFQGSVELQNSDGSVSVLSEGSGQAFYLSKSLTTIKLSAGPCVLLSLRLDLQAYPIPIDTVPWNHQTTWHSLDLHVQANVQLLMDQIARCPFACGVKRLYLEGKAFELLAHCLSEFGEKAGDQELRPADRQKIIAAKRILFAKLVDPPSIIALARQVGLNDFKLKRGFKAVFGATVYGLLRTQRLTVAKAMIESGDWNVSEAASRVGYENLSHFAKAFKLQFGCNPSELRRSGGVV